MMAASTTAVSTSSTEQLKSRKPSEETQVNEHEKKHDDPDKKIRKRLEFAHSLPVHTKPHASILSKENTEGLSFRGFGNLACANPISEMTYRSTGAGVRESTIDGGELRQGTLQLMCH